MSPGTPKFRFYLDENFPAPVGKFLRSKGHNVILATDRRMNRPLTDLEQLKYATSENRILLVLDNDFEAEDELRHSVLDSPGIILIRSANPLPVHVESIMKLVLKYTSHDSLKGKLCCASINQIKTISGDGPDRIVFVREK